MIDLHRLTVLSSLLKGLQTRFRRSSTLPAPCSAAEEVLEELHWPEDPERRFVLEGTCESCGAQDRPLNFWHFCRPCLEELDASERAEGFDFEGDCHGCGCRSTSLNRWNLCRSCTQDPNRQTLPIQPD